MNVIPLPNRVAVADVRDRVNARARDAGATDETRRRAVAHAIALKAAGKSTAWAISEGVRLLKGKEPIKHGGYPNPPPVAA